MKPQALAFRLGDTVDVHVKIVEEVLDSDAGKKQLGKKKKSSEKRERIQIYLGVVIADKHDGLRRTFTVREFARGVRALATAPDEVDAHARSRSASSSVRSSRTV